MLLESALIFISYFVWNFHSNWLLCLRVFFSEHSVYYDKLLSYAVFQKTRDHVFDDKLN